MVKQKVLALSAALFACVSLSCDGPTRLPTTGSISVVLLIPAASRSGDLVPADGNASLTLQSARVTVTGPTNKTVTSTTPNGANFDLTVTDLQPGSYTVVVEGLVGTQTAYFGQTAGVGVTAGSSTDAQVTFASFQPTVAAPSVVDTSDVLHFTVSYGAVANATSYIVAVSPNSNMSGATTKTVNTTSTDITVTSEGKYYVTVSAANTMVPSGGVPSAPKGVYAFQGVATVTVTPANPTIAQGATQQMAADAKDSDNNTVASVAWFWASSNHTVATVSQTGLVTGVGGGTATITAVGKGTPGSTNITVTALPAPAAAKLAFSIQPASTVAGDAMSPAVQVEIQDAAGNRITSSRDPVTIAFGNNAGSGTLAGTKVVNAINGIASFSGLWVNKAAAGYTLAAASGSLTGATSDPFTISAGAPAKLAFSQQPTPTQAGNVSITPAVTVTIADQFDNAVTTATNNVTVAIGTNPWKNVFGTGGATISGPALTLAAVAGVATFPGLKIDKPGPAYTLSGSATGLTNATSSAFNINMAVGAIATGGYHTCAVAVGGSFCFGNNGNGQLGTPNTTQNDSIPSLVRTAIVFTSITAGYYHSCGLNAAGAAFCWGYNNNGQLGNNSQTDSDIPVAVAGSHVFAQISAGYLHTCGVTTASATAAEDRQVYCWGYNNNGRLGDNTNVQKLVPTRVAEPLQTTTRASQVSSGQNHTCARAITGAAYCWGYDYYGQLGDAVVIPGGADKFVPTAVAGGFSFASVAAGGYHSCGVITTSGNVRCWGYNGNGQLGDGSANVNNSSPQLVSNLNWTMVSTGTYHTCGILSGTAYCWGNGGDGELGNDNTTDSNVPVQVAGSINFNAVFGGQYHTCGRAAAAVYCWGYNGNGQLGSPGTGGIKKTPTQIIQ